MLFSILFFSILLTSEEEDDDRVYYYNDEKLEMASLNSTIRSLSASSFTEEEAKEKLEIRLVVYLDNENYPQVVELVEAVNAIVL